MDKTGFKNIASVDLTVRAFDFTEWAVLFLFLWIETASVVSVASSANTGGAVVILVVSVETGTGPAKYDKLGKDHID